MVPQTTMAEMFSPNSTVYRTTDCPLTGISARRVPSRLPGLTPDCQCCQDWALPCPKSRESFFYCGTRNHIQQDLFLRSGWTSFGSRKLTNVDKAQEALTNIIYPWPWQGISSSRHGSSSHVLGIMFLVFVITGLYGGHEV